MLKNLPIIFLPELPKNFIILNPVFPNHHLLDMALSRIMLTEASYNSRIILTKIATCYSQNHASTLSSSLHMHGAVWHIRRLFTVYYHDTSGPCRPIFHFLIATHYKRYFCVHPLIAHALSVVCQLSKVDRCAIIMI